MISKTNQAKVPIALVGGGVIAPLHAEYILSSPSSELVGIIDPFPPGRALAEKLNVPHYDSVTSLISSPSNPKPEIYIICVPSGLHVKVASEVLEHASPKVLLVEKPFSTDSISGQKLLDLAEQKNCKIAVGHHRRFHSSIVVAKDAINNGKIGRITAISGQWTCKKNEGYYGVAKWRTSRAGGGGPVWTNFVHDIDVLHHLVGERVVRLWAVPTISRRKHENVSENDKIEEGAAIMLQFANGVMGNFVINDNVSSPYGWESATGDNPLYVQSVAPVDCYRVFGTEGTLSIPDGVLWTYSADDAEKKGVEVGWNVAMRREVLPTEEKIPFQEQVAHLVKLATDENEIPRCPGVEGLAAVKVCEAVVRALDKNDGIPIEIL